ncbi:hypothetical protein M569_11610 [Genlisea aurea]|uniref:Cathepsin propeptide inhibitor domain-containing protein n=1 Tax=Genlisea aurea TaxID=192259 RepID=S8C8I1_9LAMI|nr:hypothetical protein M569_11610 [Genlisea aurea]
MAAYLSKFLASIVLLWSFLPSAALDVDLSILTYDQQHLMGGIPLSDAELRGMHGSWLARYRRAYDTAGETERRFEIFKDNLKFVSVFNSFQRPYKVGLNRFADLTNEEFRREFLDARLNRDRRLSRPRYNPRYRVASGEELPESVDWREKGAVAPVKDQGPHGIGWVFSTVAAVEGINKIVTGNMTILSEQDLPDCDVAYSYGCYKFVSENNTKIIVSIDGFESVRTNDELALKKAVANQPVRVAVEASQISFQLYHTV